MDSKKMIDMAAKYKGVSQAEVARALGFTASGFNQRLKNDSLKKEDMAKIAAFLGCHFYALRNSLCSLYLIIYSLA